MPQSGPTPATWSYLLIRMLFKFVLKVFYGTIVVEGLEHIPPSGQPCVVCSNHANSLTDALLLVVAIPYKRRGMLRLTAKSTQFGRGTFTSWLIESAGTLPIKRRKDFGDADVDNSAIMGLLIEALGHGDAICLFPEGASRFHPKIAPLKTGVVRLVADAITAHRTEPDFEVSVVTCSITYMHRHHFRTDVLVTFHPPMKYKPSTHPELLAPADREAVRRETDILSERIASGTLNSPSWELTRCAWLAASIYAPLGTRMRLGDYVRVARQFLEAFKAIEASDSASPQDIEVRGLIKDLKVYGTELARLQIKDDRIRRPLARTTIVYRMALRFTWSIALLILSSPGLVLWAPVAVSTFIGVHEFKKTGPIWDTYDEIAQYKLVYGLISGLCVWALAVLLTLPFALVTAPLVPALMWMSLRWFEDAVAAARAFVALSRLVSVRAATLARLRAQRAAILARLMRLATGRLGLPDDPETAFVVPRDGGGGKGHVNGSWTGSTRYFSVTRRRKRAWSETLRLYEDFDYPEDEDS